MPGQPPLPSSSGKEAVSPQGAGVRFQGQDSGSSGFASRRPEHHGRVPFLALLGLSRRPKLCPLFLDDWWHGVMRQCLLLVMKASNRLMHKLGILIRLNKRAML